MDALNRHLRSEAGAECSRAAEEKKEGGFGGDLSGSDHGKMEDDDEKLLSVSPPPFHWEHSSWACRRGHTQSSLLDTCLGTLKTAGSPCQSPSPEKELVD